MNAKEYNKTRIRNFKDHVGELTVTYKRTKRLTQKIRTSRDAVKIIRPYFDDCMDDYECVYVMHLNNNNYVTCIKQYNTGCLRTSIIDKARILRDILLIKTAGFIIVHNHPSGSRQFSLSDREFTDNIKAISDVLEIPLLDSIVITRESYNSMADSGEI